MTNRLANATSPYLLQHKDNPVDWFEWSDEAFAEARERNVPVLLSVGYAACHWCHVMAHESFEDEATAAYMNEHYVNIKVDREERPDVDAVYMQATVALTGQGGWPMTCVLDHEGSPFFAGTYFPDQPRHGQPSFRQLLEAINDAWTNRSGEVAEASSRIREALARTVELSGGSAFDRATLDDAVDRLGRDFDAEFGGFGGAPKFPPSMVLEFLLRVSTSPTTGKGDEATNMVGRTLASMAAGGIHDQLAGGFARYGVDRAWVVPHFEKMLYDNGQLLSVYARWALLNDDEDAARVARGVADFMLAELGTDEGAFASALDADSEGEEGTFYVWTQAQLVDVLGPEDGAWAAELLTVTERGTFEGGTSTLQLRAAARRQAALGVLPRTTARGAGEACAAGARRQGGGRLERPGDQRPGRRGHPARDPVVRRSRGAVWRVPCRPSRRERAAAARLAWGSRRHARGRPGGLRLRRHRVPGAGVRHGRRCVGGSRPVPCSTRCSRTSRQRTAASTTPPTTPRR